MPIGGFTCQEIADGLGVAPTKATQAWEPAVLKLCRMMIRNPVKAHAAINEGMAIVLSEQAMSDPEIDLRRRMATGRLDRKAVHP